MRHDPPFPGHSGRLRHAAQITAKDLRQRARDRSAYVVGFLAPFGLALILSATFGGEGDEFGFEFAVHDADGGPVARELVASLAELEADEISVVVVDGLDEAVRLADEDEVAASIVVEEGFSDAVEAGRSGRLTIIGNPRADIGTDVAEAIAGGVAAEIDSIARSVATVAALEGGPPDPAALDALAERAAATDVPVRLSLDEAEGDGFDFTTYYAIGISVFFLFFTVQFGVLGLIEERDNGTLARLLVAPIPRDSVVVGKIGAALTLGLASMAVLVTSTTLVLGAHWGATGPVALLVLAGVLSAMGIIAFVGTLARTAQQANAYGAIVSVVLAVLGGSFFPIGFGPGALDLLSRLTPHRWLLDGFRDLSFGAGIADIAPNLAALAAFTVVVGGVGLARSRRLVAA